MNASTSASRTLRVLKALKGQSLTGLSNGELSKMTSESASNITRALATLIEEGLVVKLDNGRFAHSIQMLQIAQAHHDHVNQLTARAMEMNQRIAAGSR